MNIDDVVQLDKEVMKANELTERQVNELDSCQLTRPSRQEQVSSSSKENIVTVRTTRQSRQREEKSTVSRWFQDDLRRVTEENRQLKQRIEQLEHVVLQLQGETETIGESCTN
jgi:hypothetical protein